MLPMQSLGVYLHFRGGGADGALALPISQFGPVLGKMCIERIYLLPHVNFM